MQVRQENTETKLPERKTDTKINRIKKNINRVKLMKKVHYVGEGYEQKKQTEKKTDKNIMRKRTKLAIFSLVLNHTLRRDEMYELICP